MGQSRNENILENMLGASNPLGEPQSREEALLMQLLEKGGGSNVIANPTGEATDTLNKLQVDKTIYNIEGGGSADHITLTQAEYDALVQAGTVDPDAFYFIKDTNGDGQNFQPVIYSLEEREIGVWTDGKPLYEKTVYNAGGTYGTLSIAHNITNFGHCVNAFGTSYDIGFGSPRIGTGDLPLPRIASDGNNVGIIGVNSTEINIMVPDAFNDRIIDIYITLQYTKTTDQAGSGTWTPQGVPAVHYSTDEQVVGTWIDGSTLYEKTYTITAPDNGTTANLVDISDLNIDTVIDISGYLKSTNNITYKDDGFKAWIRLKSNPIVDNKDYIAMQVTNADYYSQSGNLIIRYTKSTS